MVGSFCHCHLIKKKNKNSLACSSRSINSPWLSQGVWSETFFAKSRSTAKLHSFSAIPFLSTMDFTFSKKDDVIFRWIAISKSIISKSINSVKGPYLPEYRHLHIRLCELAISLHDTQTETTVSTIRGSCQWSRDKLSASVTLTECTEVYGRWCTVRCDCSVT